MRQFGNVFNTVSVSKTNFEGQTILYAELYDVWYKMLYTDNTGKTLRLTDPSPFMTTTPSIQVQTADDVFASLIYVDGIRRNLSIVNISGSIYMKMFYQSSRPIRKACLDVFQIKGGEQSLVCSNCSTSAVATITCKIDPKYTHRAVASLDTLSNGSNIFLDPLWYVIPSNAVVMKKEGLLYSTILIFTATMMGISAITTSLLLMLVSIIAVMAMGFVFGMNLGSLWYIIVIIGIIFFIYRKGSVSF
jgi:hypothetical protein